MWISMSLEKEIHTYQISFYDLKINQKPLYLVGLNKLKFQFRC